MRNEPFKGTRNLTHCGTYAKVDTLVLHGQYPFHSSYACIRFTNNSYVTRIGELRIDEFRQLERNGLKLKLSN